MMQEYPTITTLTSLEKLGTPVDWDSVHYACILTTELGPLVLSVGDTVDECRELAITYLFTSKPSEYVFSRLSRMVYNTYLNESVLFASYSGTKDLKMTICYCDARLYIAFKRYGNTNIIKAVFDTFKTQNYARYGGIAKGVSKENVRDYFK